VLRDDDRATIIEPGPQLDWELFAHLEAGDVLFIDSSHVSKYGSEVNQLFLDILPRLPAGVNIHVHDIFWAFSYPISWLDKRRAWNEAYLLRAWLCNNPHAKITWFNNYLAHACRAQVAKALPVWGVDPGSSIWLQTV
jgi:hypothetical protein